MSTQSLKDKVQEGLTNDALVRTLRQAVKPPGKKGTWLNLLNDLQLTEVYYRLQMGKPAYAIVKIAKEEWGVKRESDSKSMAREVRKFRDRALGEIASVGSSGTPQATEIVQSLAKKAKLVSEKVDALDMFGWLINLQAARIELLHAAEKRSLPFKHTDGAVRNLGDMLGQYVKMQIDLGLIQQQPQEYNLQVQYSFSKIQEGLNGKGPQAANALGRFLQWAEEEAVTLKLDPETGSYVPVAEGGEDVTVSKQPE